MSGDLDNRANAGPNSQRRNRLSYICVVGTPRGNMWGSGRFWVGPKFNVTTSSPNNQQQTDGRKEHQHFEKMLTMDVPPPGIYVPVPTFFVPKSASNYNASAAPLDLPTQAAHAIHLAKCGIRGIVLLGSTGEAIMVSNDERKTLISHVRQELERAGFASYPIIAGTATQGIEDTVQQLKDAKDAGSQWGLVLAPGYFAPAVSQDGIISWYTGIADRTPIPILVFVSSTRRSPYLSSSSLTCICIAQLSLPRRLQQPHLHPLHNHPPCRPPQNRRLQAFPR